MKDKKIARLLYFIFLFSGISGLIYETVWLRVLSRILGSTVLASSITVAAFMFGLTLGSFLLGKFSNRIRNKIMLYAILEIGIAITALMVYKSFDHLVPLCRYFYDLSGSNMALYHVFQGAILFVVLVVPTFLMGGTLPVLSSAMQLHEEDFSKSVGFLYGLNTLGAMLGVLLSGFILLGTIGEFNTIIFGVAINLLAGIIIFFVSEKNFQSIISTDKKLNRKEEEPQSPESNKIRNRVLFTYAVIGFTSFALEIIWIRLFQLPLGTGIYSFSTVLTIYLLGSALGSYVSGKYLAHLKNPLQLLAFCMAAISLLSLAGLYIYSSYVPWQVEISIVVKPLKLFTTFLIIFPVTFATGLIFPLAAKLIVQQRTHAGSAIGRLYAFNTLGCIFGSISAGFILIPVLGTKNSLILLATINSLLAIWVLFSEKIIAGYFSQKHFAVTLTTALVVLIVFLPDPYYAVVYKMMKQIPEKDLQIRMHKETPTCTITAYGNAKDPLDKYLLINGVGMTTLVTETKLMAHLPLLLHQNPKDFLVICYGMGTCLRSAATHKNTNCDAVELVGEEYEINDFYHKNGKEVLANNLVRHFTDDGRNFLLMHDKKYDVISIDPAPPIWSAGTVNLYTTEFFKLCHKRLNPNGILCLWIPPSQATEVKMIMKSFISVYPNTEVYRGPTYPGFYMIGYTGNSSINANQFTNANNDSTIMNDINEWNNIATSAEDLLKLKIFSSEELAKYLTGVKEVSDNHPYTEFPLWRKITDKEYGVVLRSDEIVK